MTTYCKEYQEFLNIIHDKEVLKRELHLAPSIQHGRPAMTFLSSFFWKYTQEPTYTSVISQVLDLTYSTWQDYCVQMNVIDIEDMKNSYCEIMSNIFKANGIK